MTWTRWLPPGVVVRPVYDRSTLIEESIDTLRRTLVDSHRHRLRQKRGGGLDEIPLENVMVAAGGGEIDALALDQALQRLEAIDPMAARTVKLLAFEGLSYDEAAKEMGVGRATVSRGWRFARAFLRLQLANGTDPL